MKSPINTIRYLRGLIDCWVENPVAKRLMHEWLDKNILEFGRQVIVSREEREHTKGDKKFDEYRFRQLAHEFGTALVKDCCEVQTQETLYGDETTYRVYAIIARDENCAC